MSDFDDDIPTQSYWPSVTDLFLTLFIIAIAIVAVVFCALLPTNNVGKDRSLVHAVGNDLENVREPMNRLRKTLELEPVEMNLRPSEVIKALAETSDTAVSEIGKLRDQVKLLQGPGDQIEELLKENVDLRKKIEDLEKRIIKLQEDYAKLRRSIGADPDLDIPALIAEVGNLRRQLHDKPPIIRIDEQNEEYRFESGSSIIGLKFSEGLRKNEFERLAGEIIERQEEGRVKVDTLEIIGHTDGVPLSAQGNLDNKLPNLLAGEDETFKTLKPGSNNDLGLLRALAVRKEWDDFVKNHASAQVLSTLSVRCYSAGQTILPDHKNDPVQADFRRDDPRARRIEMRLTRLAN